MGDPMTFRKWVYRLRSMLHEQPRKESPSRSIIVSELSS